MQPNRAEIDQADEIATFSGSEVMAEIYKCLKMQWFRKLERIIAALIRRRGQQVGREEVSGVAKHLKRVVPELQKQRGRLEQLIEDSQPGLPEYRLAEDLLDALGEYEAVGSVTKNHQNNAELETQ